MAGQSLIYPLLQARSSSDLVCPLRRLAFIPTVMLVLACTTHEVVIGARGASGSTAQSGSDSAPPAAGTQAERTATDLPDAAAGGSIGTMGNRAGAASVATSEGCGVPLNAGPNSLQWEGVPVSYLVDAPADYDNTRAYPLVVAFRGAPENAGMFRTSLNMVAEAGSAAIIVHPETANGAPYWRAPDDVPLFDSLLSHLMRRYCVDPTQVFAVGYAQGGWLVSAYACTHGNRLRAAALFAGTSAEAPCKAPVAMLVVQGDADKVYSVIDGRETRDSWVTVNQCDAAQTSPLQDSPCIDYTGCPPDAPVRYCEFKGGHELPTFAAAATWRFFSMLR